jgi:hypothetical protein
MCWGLTGISSTLHGVYNACPPPTHHTAWDPDIQTMHERWSCCARCAQGTHEELMKLDRYYAYLVAASQV